jgi:branched-chain amino acid transport system ATP-binding protein
MGAISGVVPVSGGTVRFDGHDITALSPRARIELGIAHVLERHRLFAFMTARENLLLGAYIPRARAQTQESLDWVLTLFPFLRTRLSQHAGAFSGGEQQMLAIARGLMSRPRLIMLDEPFLGLSPAMVRGIIEVVAGLRASGMTVVFIEQHIRHSLTMADRAYVLEAGRVALSGASDALLASDEIQQIYMGMEAPPRPAPENSPAEQGRRPIP